MTFSIMTNVSFPLAENNNSLSTSTSSLDLVDFQSTVVLLSLEIFIALFGNGLVILAFYRFHNLRTVTNYFVVSLAVADVLVASLSMPVWLYMRICDIKKIPNGDQLMQKVLYYSWQYMDILCSTASIASLCMISIDRYTAINSPLTYLSRVTPKRAKVSIALGWLYAFVCATLSVVTVVKSIKPIAGSVYGIFISFAGFFVPLTVLIIVYSKILCLSLRQVRQIHSVRSAIQRRIHCQNTRSFRRELKVTKMLGVVVGAFIVCWGPFFFIVLVFAVCRTCPVNRAWGNLSKWLHYSNSFINPMIYTLFTTSFRSAFRQLILRRFCCKLGLRARVSLRVSKIGSVEPVN